MKYRSSPTFEYFLGQNHENFSLQKYEFDEIVNILIKIQKFHELFLEKNITINIFIYNALLRSLDMELQKYTCDSFYKKNLYMLKKNVEKESVNIERFFSLVVMDVDSILSANKK